MTENQNKRNRRTRAQMLEHYKAQIARLEAAEQGRPDTSTESGILKSLKSMLRKRRTALRSATIVVDGITGGDGKVARAPLSETIKRTEERLAKQRATLAESTEQKELLPSDIERLDALVNAAEQGEDVEIPTDLLVRLDSDAPRSDEQAEAEFIAKGEEGEES